MKITSLLFFIALSGHAYSQCVKPPVAHITALQTSVCQGDSVLLNAYSDSMVTYQWYLNNSPLTGATDSVLYALAGVYKVVVSNDSCSAADSVTISVKPKPSSPLVTVTNLCGSSILFTTSSGSLLWFNSATTSSITVTGTGPYTVTATINGCTGNAAAVPANPKPVPAAPVITVTNNCNGTSTLCTPACTSLMW